MPATSNDKLYRVAAGAVALAAASVAFVVLCRTTPDELRADAAGTDVRGVEAKTAELADCEARGRLLQRQLGTPGETLVTPPFVMSGNLTMDRMNDAYRQVVSPTCQALQALYFDRQPSQPVAVFLYSDESSYRQAAERLFLDRNVSRFGYYKPGRRALLVNLAEGASSLRHELTHALMAVDFPTAPAWLKEGMASMYEAGVMDLATDPPGIAGGANWRLAILQRAIASGSREPLAQLVQRKTLHESNEAVNFAHAQALCLFLEQRELMTRCYRLVRNGAPADPTGLKTLDLLLPGFSSGNVDREFCRWAKAQIVSPASN